jgi:hypothetical protein
LSGSFNKNKSAKQKSPQNALCGLFCAGQKELVGQINPLFYQSEIGG